MKINQIVRAWKDHNYRQTLSESEQLVLPTHPSGMIELKEADLGVVTGAATTANCNTRQEHCTATHWFVCTLHPCS